MNFLEEYIGTITLIRGNRSGVWIGTMANISADGRVVELVDARNIWYWAGAAALSQVSQSGINEAFIEQCKICEAVDKVILTDCIQFTVPTKQAAKIILEATPWKK